MFHIPLSDLRELPLSNDAEQSRETPLITEAVLARRLGWARVGVLNFLAVTVASAYLTRHCLAVANTTMQAELNFNNEQFGYLYSAFSIGYLICQVPGGWLGQRFGTRFALPLLSFLWSLMTLITSVAWTFPTLFSARLGFGLAQAGLIPNQAQVLKDWIPTESRGSASAVVTTAMAVGSIGSLQLTSWLLGLCHWRTLLFSYSLAGIGWSVLFYLVFRTSPREVPWLQQKASDQLAVPPSDSHGEPPAILNLQELLARSSFWAMFFQMAFKAAGYNLLVIFFPAFLELAYGVSKDQAGQLTSWSLVTGLIGSIVGGRVVDRVQRATQNKKLSRNGVAWSSLMLTAIIMWAGTYSTTATQMAFVIAIASLVVGLSAPCAWAASIDIGGRNTAVVMGFMNMGGAVAGIVFSPLIGRLMDYVKVTNGNWNLVIHAHAAFYFIAAMCWLMINPNRALNSVENDDAV